MMFVADYDVCRQLSCLLPIMMFVAVDVSIIIITAFAALNCMAIGNVLKGFISFMPNLYSMFRRQLGL